MDREAAGGEELAEEPDCRVDWQELERREPSRAVLEGLVGKR